MTQHLTDEQFANLMAGDCCDHAARVHAESCEICRVELASTGRAVDNLNDFSRRWAEQRAARIQVPSSWALNWRTLPGWSATMAGVLVFGIALGAHIQTSSSSAATQTPHARVTPSVDELAQDNRLMQSIETEINEQPGAQTAATALDDGSRASRRRYFREVSN